MSFKPSEKQSRISSTRSHVQLGSSRSHLQLKPLLQEHCRPVLTSSWGRLVLTFSYSPSSKNIVDQSILQLGSSRSHLQLEPLLQEHCLPVYTSVGVVSFSPSVRALLQEHRRPVLTSSWGRLVLTFSYSPSSKNIVLSAVPISKCKFLQVLNRLSLETIPLFKKTLSL